MSAEIPPTRPVVPHNFDAEKGALGSVMVNPFALQELPIPPGVDEFFLPQHRSIWEGMLALHARGEPIDPILLKNELQGRGVLGTLDGGEGYLLTLANEVPTPLNFRYYLRLVNEAWIQRRLVATFADLQARANGQCSDLPSFVREAEEAIAKLARSTGATSTHWKTPAERALQLGRWGPPLPTGIRAIDDATRGGLRPGVVVLGGPPSAGKTLLLVQIARVLAERGVYVTILAADEDADGLLVRIGQALGFARRALETGDGDARIGLARLLEAMPTLDLIDGVEDDVMIEGAGEDLLKRANGSATVLAVDSFQTARAAGTDVAESDRRRIDSVAAAFKRLARRGIHVLVSSEVNRGSYKSRNPDDRCEDMASYKESGSIEYLAHLAVNVRSVPGDGGALDLTVTKSRWGSRDHSARLLIDFDMATLREVPVPPGSMWEPKLNSIGLFELDLEAARQALRENPGIAGNDRLVSLLRGLSKARARAAVRCLDAAGEIQNLGTPKRPKLYLAGAVAGVAPHPPESPGGLDGAHPPHPPAPFRGGGCGAGSAAGPANGAAQSRNGAGHDPWASAEEDLP